jgi:rhamnose transport system ATP-binding protein
MAAGIAYVSEDRRKMGLAMPMSLRANISLATLPSFMRRFGMLDTPRETAVAEGFRERLNIRTPDIELPVGMLSGGNQQKVMLAKWLNMEPKILIFDEPTRGIDVGAKAEVHDLIRTFVRDGGAALVISSDLPEVLALGDRILVMREGRQMGVVASEDATQERVMALATGQAALREAS